MSRKPQMTRRSVLTTTGAVSLLGLAGVASGSAPSDGVPIPDDAGERTYPTIGTNSDAPTATFYGNFKCPSSQDFVSGNLQEIISEFVTEGLLNVEFCNLAYEPGDTSQAFISGTDSRLAAVGLAVWDEDPNSYWQYVTETYTDMPSGYISYDELENRARAADVSNVDAVIERAEAGEYDADVEEVATLASNDGITYTPQLELAGDTTAPHHGTQAIIDWLDSRLDDAPEGEKSEEKLEDDSESDDDSDVDDDSESDDGDEDAEEPQEESEVEDAEDEEAAESDETEESQEGDDDSDDYADDDSDDYADDDSDDYADDDSDDYADDDSDDYADDDSDDYADDDSDDYADDDSDDYADDDTSGGSSDGSIGAGEDYDLSDDRTVDDLPVDC
ncbi:thioredoxin domain-containing protein [Natronococcus sp. A-GB1]|uniref:DsbA family protein n=1 Tax=Natronococcus sp. A-GB1 TaxID=3037648 RepID=UPI00241E3F2F|nr:thioredoxin domain-containing protein [Natronococcus sp. A-GB1]MDG5761191.1 thioredoxin domain-containing protein [Natronococcus sp. A-GB1]